MDPIDEKLIVYFYSYQTEQPALSFTIDRTGKELKSFMWENPLILDEVATTLSRRHEQIRDAVIKYFKTNDSEMSELITVFKSIELLSYNFIGSTNIPL